MPDVSRFAFVLVLFGCVIQPLSAAQKKTERKKPDAKQQPAEPDKPAWLKPADQIGVFELPPRFHAIRQRLAQRQIAMQQGKLKDAEKFAQEAADILPVPETLLFLAASQAELGKTKEALVSLRRAIAAGMNKAPSLQEPVFAGVRELVQETEGKAAWSKLLADTEKATLNPDAIWKRSAKPAEVGKNGIATATPENTMWVPQGNVLVTQFTVPEENKKKQISRIAGRVGELLRKWQLEGTAAGNHGDFYDNHDRGHSRFKFDDFPQISRIRYSQEARSGNLDWGAQTHMLFSGVVMGNSSTSLTMKGIWRSQPRLIASDASTITQLYNQYTNNHIYLYPEHRDYDAGHNKKGPEKGYGDVYFANLPYVMTSKGSSGSDRPFMTAVVATLAAFQPDVKKKLIENKMLMPALQMIFRRSNKTVTSDEEYLSGIAHPPVFDSKNLDTVAMIERAHSMTSDKLPPLARMRVTKESRPEKPEGHSGPMKPERIFDTFGCVSRIHRTAAYERVMEVDASLSRDTVRNVARKNPDANDGRRIEKTDGKNLTYHWKVLIGDSDRIKIEPLNKNSSKVRITIPWHKRYKIAEDSDMETNRVDIGLFVSNGNWYSAPAMLCTYFPDNEDRKYDPSTGKLLSLTKNQNYADPVLVNP